MKNCYLGILACFILSFQLALAQPICGFDKVHERRLKTDPVYQQQVSNTERNIREYIQTHPRTHSGTTTNSAGPSATTLGTALYTIPVVVHVIHTGGAVGTIYNPTDAQILGAIDYLNQVYNGSYPGTLGAGDLQIQFAIAQRDPNCNPTNGIVRVDGSVLSGYASGGVNESTSLGTDEINVKNLSRWDPTQYYNIWVVDKIDAADGTSGQFIAGFAYFPGGNPNYDGIIMLATQMVSGQKTLPHEIGHAFNLYHPFQGSANSTSCPANANCNTDGDQVCDTDPITYNQSGGIIDFSCRSGINTCTGVAYSNSTESNYMNYTNCYNQFTAGQKARMLASAASSARSSLSSSPGATPTNVGPTFCPPKINFELSSDLLTETAGTTSGCRTYKDYTYNMVIGSGPSVTATATLNITGGTATETADFDITTNGNFASPSKTLTFLAGSAASQPFTIRIYDDADVESTENFTLGFTVNNGGGNALAGDGRPTLTISIADNDSAPTNGTSTGTASIGTALYTINAAPFDAKQQSLRVQFLYKASELIAAGIPAGSLTGIALDVQSKLSTRAFTGLTIKIGTAPVAYLVNAGINLGSGMTVVKTAASYSTVAGWNSFVFDTPYTWDGTSNLVVEMCFSNAAAAAGDAADLLLAYSDGGTGTQGNILWQDGINCGQAFTSVGYYGNGVKPIIRFTYGIPATAVQTALNASRQEYLGPNDDVYFYDQTGNKLMARIQNLSSFDYGCTQVTIDRAGTSASQFWNVSPANYIMDKTFHVVPTTNNPSGNYLITLYYTQAEINGWQSFTGQSVSNISLIKTALQTANVTPASPTGAGAMVTGAATVATLGTNTALSYHFTTGFSGFGAGVIGVVLPVASIDLQGHLDDDYAVLNWNVPAGMANKGYDVQRAYDGVHFITIGQVSATGNGQQAQQYAFRDPSMVHPENYYRLQETDAENNKGFSKVVLLESTLSGDGLFRVLNNPFSNNLEVQLGTESQGSIDARIMDMTGKTLYHQVSGSAGSTQLHIDLSGSPLSKGMYLLEVWVNNARHVAKVIKQ